MGLSLYFTTSCTVLRMSSPDGSWGAEAAWEPAGTLVGWIQPGSGKLHYRDGRIASVSTHLLFCPAEADLRAGDRLAAAGRDYRVIAVQDAAGRGHHREAELEEVC